MTAVSQGVVVLSIGNQTYHLQFTIDAICVVEELTGKPISHVAAQMMGGRVTALRALLWGGLREQQPKLSTREAGELLRLVAADVVVEKIGEALKAAFPNEGAADDGDKRPPQTEDGTGPTS